MTDANLLSRRELIERYVQYDSEKKSREIPDTSGWDWDSPDDLDEKLKTAGFKHGCITGFLQWKLCQFDKETLAGSAVDIMIAKSLDTNCRSLGEFSALPAFMEWKPDRRTSWFDQISGGDFSQIGLLIVRPSVPCEQPAHFYFIDGSGRATTVFKRLVETDDDLITVPVIVGSEPDANSTFMREKYRKLLEGEN